MCCEQGFAERLAGNRGDDPGVETAACGLGARHHDCRTGKYIEQQGLAAAPLQTLQYLPVMIEEAD